MIYTAVLLFIGYRLLLPKHGWGLRWWMPAIFIGWYAFALPGVLFVKPQSLVLLSNNGSLLGAKIAADGQWRFPVTREVPDRFAKCIVAFEDKRFYEHAGVDVLALSRALRQNVFAGRKISGASTISMQVVRLLRDNPERTYLEKVYEMLLATRLEMRYSKKQILNMYASNAPFGGNVAGLDAAAWRYYSKPATELSWGQMAALAVLPNSPALVHPGRNHHILYVKRNRLLDKLWQERAIDSATCALAKLENLPGKPHELPDVTPHLLGHAWLQLKGNEAAPHIVKTTIDQKLQEQVNEIIERHSGQLQGNGVYNAAALVINVHTNEVLVYAGNAKGLTRKEFSGDVDNIHSLRSPGSTLKPLLYASMLNDGKILPDMLVPDIPLYINSFTPKNYNATYDGAVPASQALARSLNIPAVEMLQNYTPASFLRQLQRMGIHSLNKPAGHYGLSLILGGGEVSLWELAGAYSGMARTLWHYQLTSGRYYPDDFRAPCYLAGPGGYKQSTKTDTMAPLLRASSIWLAFDAMLKVARPDEERFWQFFANARKIAWKTGTSFGNRDAWAIGCTPDYVVAVWAGNCNGEGRAELTGIGSAAPVLFDIFNVLPVKSSWFAMPGKDMERAMLCRLSGHIAGEHCDDKVEGWIPKGTQATQVCPYHTSIFVDWDKNERVNDICESVGNMRKLSWFILPPTEEKYYRLKHPEYASLPPFRKDCNCSQATSEEEGGAAMSLVYPQHATKIYLPVNLDASTSSTVFEAAHRDNSATIYWHLDGDFIGVTKNGNHQLSLNPSAGKHTLILTDNKGESLKQKFEIIQGRKKG